MTAASGQSIWSSKGASRSWGCWLQSPFEAQARPCAEVALAAGTPNFSTLPSRRIAGGFRSVWGVLFESRRHPPGHLTEADTVAVALAPAGDNHVVPVLQE